MPVIMRMTTVHAVAHRNKRTASELARIGWREQIAEAAHRLYDVDAEFFADAADEDLDRIGVAVKVLIVEMLDQFGARHHAAGMVHQIGQQPVFVRGQLDGVSIHRDASSAGVETNRPASELAFGVTGRTAQQRRHRNPAPCRSSGRARSGSARAWRGRRAATLPAPKCRPSWAGRYRG